MKERLHFYNRDVWRQNGHQSTKSSTLPKTKHMQLSHQKMYQYSWVNEEKYGSVICENFIGIVMKDGEFGFVIKDDELEAINCIAGRNYCNQKISFYGSSESRN